MPKPPNKGVAEDTSQLRPASRTCHTRSTAMVEAGKSNPAEQTAPKPVIRGNTNTAQSTSLAPKKKVSKPKDVVLTPLQEIAHALSGALAKGKTLEWVKRKIKGILEYTKVAEELERTKGDKDEGLPEVSEMHKSIKADLSTIYNTLHE